jgi:hypothetical protein
MLIFPFYIELSEMGYLFKKRLKIAIIRDNQKLQMKGQTNLWSKKKDKQLFTKHNPQNSPTPVASHCQTLSQKSSTL